MAVNISEGEMLHFLPQVNAKPNSLALDSIEMETIWLLAEEETY